MVRRSAGFRSSSDGRTHIPSCGNTTRRRNRQTGSRPSRRRDRSRGSPVTAAGSRRSGNSRRRFRYSRKPRSIYAASERWIEAADWIVWQLCGAETRNACTAGYKGIFQDGRYPSEGFLGALHDGFAGFVSEKLEHPLAQLGARAGSLTAQAAAWTGLNEGIAVAVGNVDAHVTAPAARAIEPGHMLAVMGTSTCHVMNGDRLAEVPGMCGVVDGGITPGLLGYEAGQSGVGDIFGWFVEQQVPPAYHVEAERRGLSVHRYLSELASAQEVGQHGLVALDWHSGNRSVLVDHELSGVLVGMTLSTRPEDIYRALIEATAFGTRTIIEAFERHGVPVHELTVAGGLLKNALLMQIYSDVMRRPLHVIESDEGPSRGRHARRRGSRRSSEHHHGRGGDGQRAPRRVPAGRGKCRRLRPALCALLRPPRHFRRRHDDARPSPALAGKRRVANPTILDLRRLVCELHAELPKHGLVVWTSGNLSARVPGEDLMVIKASGVDFEAMTPESVVVCDLFGELVDGELAPSSDAATHGYVYRHMPEIGGVAHTHSAYATAFAARATCSCVLTAIADEFGGAIPIGPFARIGDEEIGRGIVETLRDTGHRRCSCAVTESSRWARRRATRSRRRSCVRTLRARFISLERSESRCSSSPTTSTRSTTATRTSTANAERARCAHGTGPK